MDPVDEARTFVAERYPDAVAAFLGGSASSGTARPSSDLDVVVILGSPWEDVAFVETVTHRDRLVEAFVYGTTGLHLWLEKGRAGRRPVVDRLVGEGVPLLGTALEGELGAASREALAAGPRPIEDDELRLRRYALSALLDDLADAADDGTAQVVAWTLWREAAETALLVDRRWLGTGKWLLRELRREPDRHGLVEWAENPEPPALVDAARSVLASAGGYLQAGMVRGTKPGGLSPASP